MTALSNTQANKAKFIKLCTKTLLSFMNTDPLIKAGRYAKWQSHKIKNELVDCYESGCYNTDLIHMADVFLMLKRPQIVRSEVMDDIMERYTDECDGKIRFMHLLSGFDNFHDFYHWLSDKQLDDYDHFRAFFLSELGYLVQEMTESEQLQKVA